MTATPAHVCKCYCLDFRFPVPSYEPRDDSRGFFLPSTGWFVPRNVCTRELCQIPHGNHTIRMDSINFRQLSHVGTGKQICSRSVCDLSIQSNVYLIPRPAALRMPLLWCPHKMCCQYWRRSASNLCQLLGGGMTLVAGHWGCLYEPYPSPPCCRFVLSVQYNLFIATSLLVLFLYRLFNGHQ